MNLSVAKPSLLKIAIVFTGCILVIDLVIDLFATHFKTSLLLRMLSWEYYTFDIIPELLISFLCAVGTTLITSKLKDFTWKSTILRILAFASFYTVLCMLISFILFITVNGINWKLYNPVDFIFFITGIRVAFIFQVVWVLVKYRQIEHKES
ncbi:hypothetical protein D3C87_83850 [compost metagenome]